MWRENKPEFIRSLVAYGFGSLFIAIPAFIAFWTGPASILDFLCTMMVVMGTFLMVMGALGAQYRRMAYSYEQRLRKLENALSARKGNVSEPAD